MLLSPWMWKMLLKKFKNSLNLIELSTKLFVYDYILKVLQLSQSVLKNNYNDVAHFNTTVMNYWQQLVPQTRSGRQIKPTNPTERLKHSDKGTEIEKDLCKLTSQKKYQHKENHLHAQCVTLTCLKVTSFYTFCFLVSVKFLFAVALPMLLCSFLIVSTKPLVRCTKCSLSTSCLSQRMFRIKQANE